MKVYHYTIIGISAVIVLWIAIFGVYAAKINTVYLCAQATNLQSDTDLDQLTVEPKQHSARMLDKGTYAAELKTLMREVQLLPMTERRAFTRKTLARIMGGSYHCPALEDLIAQS